MSSSPAFPQPNPAQPNRSLPPRVRAGDLLQWEVATSFPVGYSVFFVLTGLVRSPAGGRIVSRIQIAPVAVDVNGLATFAAASTVTSAWAPGKYQWVCFATDANANREELAQGDIVVSPDPAGTLAVDPRSRNEKLLEAIKCLMDGRALDDAQMYKIGTRELTKMDLKQLLYWEGVVESRVRREKIRRGEYKATNTIGVTFGGR